MSDSDYMAFLQRQQQQAEALAATTTTTGDLRKRDIGALGTGEEPHAAILSLLQDNSVQEKFYNSGLDVEEFKDVTLEWGKEEMPSEDEFATLISADHVTKEPFSSWDPRGRYHETEAAIKEASGSNEVLVYRASGEGASFNYFVLAKAVKNSRLVGVRFSAVEDVEDDE
ncbi:hypothetical protein BZA77DRAFT_350236 [Pyronema omphalodes]|nr:hypothetical protein BZA77DRAFT_350236 [Pyronema omphalodes]